MRLKSAFPLSQLLLLLVYLHVSCFLANAKKSTDFYDLLGVSKDASLKEIRKAFKALAVLQHPDKNPDDPDATSKFIKLTRAYDILKDTELRKQYDLYGEEGISPSTNNQGFKSYSYYKNEFGIYDDDPLIVTLSKADYDVNVLDENQAWWINFYSPACHHCHTLAPTWRKLSQELEGVVRIAAVNCEDDYVLCHQIGVGAYPTLLYYEKEAHLHDGEKYTGPKEFDAMQDFIISKLRVSVEHIDAEVWEEVKDKNWLLFLCGPFGGERCPEPQVQIKLAAVFEGLMSVGIVNDEELCDKLSQSYKTQPVVLYQVTGDEIKVDVIEGSDKREMVDSVLNFLPTPEHLDEKQFSEIRNNLRSSKQEEKESNPWLICFYLGTATELNLQLKRLPTIIPNIKIGLIHCGKSSGLCSALHVSRYPTWGLLKPGGAFELHHGRDVLHEVADFARDGSKATNLHALSPADYKGLQDDPNPWFIDWYAPWCPPCRRLMPEIRKASQRFTPNEIKFGTIDCTLHQALCTSENIRSYPTTMIYQKGEKQLYHGSLSEHDIVEHVQETLNPSVVHLTQENFVQLMRKPVGDIWLVDYYAPWCGPCQRLMPVWRQLARDMKEMNRGKSGGNVSITIASIDCVKEADLCAAQNINSYPMIRLYPKDSYGLNSVAMYTGHRDLMNLKSWIFAFLPTKVVALTGEFFKKRIMKRSLSRPWLVDFYAPWCGHCVDFEPKFRIIAEDLDGIARAGKLDCQAERNFCISLRVTSYPTLRLYFSKDNYQVIDARSPEFVVQETRRLIEAHGQYNHDEL